MPTVFEIYLCCSLATALCMILPTNKAISIWKAMGGEPPEPFTFYSVSIVFWIVLAPIFLVVFIGASKGWTMGVLQFLVDEDKDGR